MPMRVNKMRDVTRAKIASLCGAIWRTILIFYASQGVWVNCYRIHQKSLNFIYPFKLYSNFTNKNVSWLHFSWATQYTIKLGQSWALWSNPPTPSFAMDRRLFHHFTANNVNNFNDLQKHSSIHETYLSCFRFYRATLCVNAVLAVGRCPSVCPSHSYLVSKWLN